MFRGLQALAVVMFVWALLGIVPRGQSNPAAPQRSGVTIVGSVVDAGLAPIPGVAITLERGGRVEKNTTTDAAGGRQAQLKLRPTGATTIDGAA